MKKVSIGILMISMIVGGVYLTRSKNSYEYPFFPAMGNETHIEHIEPTGLSSDTTEVPVFKTKPVINPTEKAKTLATRFNLKDYKTSENERSISLVSEDSSIEFFKNSGSFVYLKKVKPEDPSNLPSLEQAKSLANSFVKSLGYNDYAVSKVAEEKRYNPISKGKENEVTVGINVFFSKKLKNMEIYGGDRIEIDFGSNGEITKAFFLTRDYEESNLEKTISPQEAFDRARKGNGAVYTESSAKHAVINKSSIAYWTAPAPEFQKDVIPVYIFEGTTDENKAVTIITPAIEVQPK
ncbi:hypothetical protein [Effusibacillus consociatus]|uniref:Regulatory protein YycH-like domain-containing protein n=1 Tax=Effusibacillus consociatus TaxID=1117041 RepID=A0ABV9Q7E4_9BACL